MGAGAAITKAFETAAREFERANVGSEVKIVDSASMGKLLWTPTSRGRSSVRTISRSYVTILSGATHQRPIMPAGQKYWDELEKGRDRQPEREEGACSSPRNGSG